MLGDIVRVHIAILALALVAFLSACGTSPEQKAACDELAEMACDFTPDKLLLDYGAEVMGQETPGQKGLYAKSKCSGDTLNRIKLED